MPGRRKELCECKYCCLVRPGGLLIPESTRRFHRIREEREAASKPGPRLADASTVKRCTCPICLWKNPQGQHHSLHNFSRHRRLVECLIHAFGIQQNILQNEEPVDRDNVVPPAVGNINVDANLGTPFEFVILP